MCVLYEFVSETEFMGRAKNVFSVGLIAACYRHGPLGICSAPGWLPSDQVRPFNEQAGLVIDEMSKDVTTFPDAEIIELSELIGSDLMDQLDFELRTEKRTLQ